MIKEVFTQTYSDVLYNTPNYDFYGIFELRSSKKDLNVLLSCFGCCIVEMWARCGLGVETKTLNH